MSESDRRRGHVLVVDGENSVGRTVQECLLLDHDVEIENRADEVIRRIDGGAQYDLILCDVMMPGCTGPELCAKLAVAHQDQAVGMVFMTDGAMSESARESLAKMSNLCIRRPFDSDGMRALVRRRMAHGRA
jgi:CheY-like chemotaxis protein